MAAPINIHKPKVLLGEGRDEEMFFDALLHHMHIQDVQVIEYGGKHKLGSTLKTLVPRFLAAQVQSIVVTRDVDLDDISAAHALATVQRSLAANDLPAPPPHGQFNQGTPKVGIWLMPDGVSIGMLEDLCFASVGADPAIACVNDFFTCVQATANRQPRLLPKARIHAWLASLGTKPGQLDPDNRLGNAAKQGHWPFQAPAFTSLKAFLQQM